ncbi:MAG: NADH-quinone oxidoreductase subunit N [Planctomycetes bacterium]|nr:NADH-quinone oxidoreductase subunit N [Planctomycetota bacterium]
MDAAAQSYSAQLAAIAPELTLLGVALVVLVADLWTKGKDGKLLAWLSVAGLVLVGALLYGQSGEPKTVFAMVDIDQFGRFFKLFTVASLVVVMGLVVNDRQQRLDDVGEYFFLLLSAGLGVFFMVSTTNLLLLMLGLELLSLCSYALAGFHKGNMTSAEASMKYVVFGGLSAGIMLYGISLMYGLTGTLDLVEMSNSATLAAQLSESPVPVAVAIVLVIAGFAYKISAVPFHFWTPDVYEGAPTPVTTFLAVASKAAGFGALLRFLGAMFMTEGVNEVIAEYGKSIGALLALIAAVTMTMGNLSALKQSSLKRMLAYSSIAHAGYVLIGAAAMTAAGFEAAMWYLAAYYFMNLGAFAVVLYFEAVTGSDKLENLKGLGPKYPMVSVAMVALLVSLTGLPPTVGFYGKYLLFVEGVDAGLMWLVVVAALNSVVSLFYYFRVAKALFLEQGEDAPTVLCSRNLSTLILLLGAGSVYFFFAPDAIQVWAAASLDMLGG